MLKARVTCVYALICTSLLGSDISVVQQKVRQKNAQLEDLHRRVLRLSKSLHDASPDKAFATTKLRLDEDIRQQHLGDQSCSFCGKQLLLKTISQHANNCIDAATSSSLPILPTPSNQSPHWIQTASASTPGRSSAVALPSIRSEPILPRFVSQPPRNLRVVEDGVDHRSILLAWDPPIFTGSNPIIDYELRFSTRRTSDKANDRQVSVEPLLPVLTSRWCLQVPVAPNQFRVDGLEATQEYCDFLLCAITINGKSEASNPSTSSRRRHRSSRPGRCFSAMEQSQLPPSRCRGWSRSTAAGNRLWATKSRSSKQSWKTRTRLDLKTDF